MNGVSLALTIEREQRLRNFELSIMQQIVYYQAAYKHTVTFLLVPNIIPWNYQASWSCYLSGARYTRSFTCSYSTAGVWKQKEGLAFWFTLGQLEHKLNWIHAQTLTGCHHKLLYTKLCGDKNR